MVATSYYTHIFDLSLEPVKQILNRELHDSVARIDSFTEALDKKDFLLALYLYIGEEPEHKHKFEGTGNNNGWVVKARFDHSSNNLVLKTPKQSLFIVKENVKAIKEIAEDFLIIHLVRTDLLIINNWEVKHRIKEHDLGNIEKYQMLPFPDFSPDDNPFVITTGAKGFNLVNVSTGSMQRLLNLEMMIRRGQELMFF